MKKIYSLLIVLLFVAGCSTKGNVFSLGVGDCFDDPDGIEIANVDLVDCNEAHTNEVYATADLPDGDYPFGSLESDVWDICYGAFESFVGEEYEWSMYEIGGLWPTQDSWEKADDREVVCYLYDMFGGSKTGTAANSGL